MLRLCKTLVLLSAFLAGAFAATAQAGSLRVDTDLGASWRLDSIARLMAGLEPSYPQHARIAATQAWKSHSAAMQSMWKRLRAERAVSMLAWRDKHLPGACPGGRTLLYPFSGPDFFNVYWLFPECENFVLFGLEHIGQVPDLESLSERELAQFGADLRAAGVDLLKRNYFITDNMTRQLNTSKLRGVVPLFLTSMALSGVEIVRVAPQRLDAPAAESAGDAQAAAEKNDAPVKRRSLRVPRGVSIEFRTPDSAAIRRLVYFSVDVSDASMAMYPEFLAYLRTLGATTTLVKSASYLLHYGEFSRLRSTLLGVTALLVQDDTGVPYKTLLSGGWDVGLYGVYTTPIPPFESAFQPALYAEYQRLKPAPLGFDFGYNHRDRRNGRALVMIARKPAPVLAGSARAAIRISASPQRP